MQGEARYGESRFQSIDQLDGLSRLMGTVAQSKSPEAPQLQTDFFATAMKTLEDKPEVNSYYAKNIGMKDALATTFQQDYDNIVMSYRHDTLSPNQLDNTMSSEGLKAFKEFFGDVLFSPPLGNGASSTARFFSTKMGQFALDAKNMTDSEFMRAHGLSKTDYAELMGTQSAALSKALSESLAAIQQNADGTAQSRIDAVNAFVTAAEGSVGVGLAELPPAAVAAFTLLEAGKLVADKQITDSSNQSVQQAKDELAKVHINVDTPAGEYDFYRAISRIDGKTDVLQQFKTGQSEGAAALA
jgi:hypothetical protein